MAKMPRYIVNRRSKLYHDTFLITDKCNIPRGEALSGYALVQVDSLSDPLAGTAALRLCEHCAAQRDLERSGV